MSMASTSKFNTLSPLLELEADRRSPEWGRKEEQITGPGEVYTWESSWEFGLL